MTTNSQVALQAAAEVFSGGRQHTSPDTVLGMAYVFKRWLDKHDTLDAERPTVSEEPLCSPRNAAPPLTLWTALVRPRNSNADWRLVKLVAGSADQATSHLLAAYPGHAWAELTDTGERSPVPVPRPPSTYLR